METCLGDPQGAADVNQSSWGTSYLWWLLGESGHRCIFPPSHSAVFPRSPCCPLSSCRNLAGAHAIAGWLLGGGGQCLLSPSRPPRGSDKSQGGQLIVSRCPPS